MPKVKAFYAVRKGRQAGIFNTWLECEAQIKNYPGARYKKFPSEEEAQLFVKNVSPAKTTKTEDQPASGAGAKRKTPSYPNLSSSSVNGGPRRTQLLEAPPPSSSKVGLESATVRQLHTLREKVEEIRKSVKDFAEKKNEEMNAVASQISSLINGLEGEEGPAPKLAKVDFPDGERLRKGGFVVSPEDGAVEVFTDGACEGNGKANARAGVGVWWNHGHASNFSAPLHDDKRQTNNVAEIQACIEAINIAKKNEIKRLRINTDSQFTINCITQWMAKWKRNGFKKSTGEEVVNKDELLELDALISDPSVIKVLFNHVRGHQGVEGNEQADRLAVEGARAKFRN